MATRLLVSIVVVGGLLAWALRDVDLRQLGIALLDVDARRLLLGLAVQLAVMWIKSVRLSVAIRGAVERPVRCVFSASMIGFAGNVLLPARLGELARVSIIEKHNWIGLPLLVTIVGITQVFDLLALAGYFVALGVWATSLFMTYRWALDLLGIVLLSILASLMVVGQKTQSLRVLLLPICEKLPVAIQRRVTGYAGLFVQGFGILSKGRVVSWVLLTTVAIWSLETVATYLLLLAFHINATLQSAAMLVIVLNLSFIFPITPGNAGMFQAVSVLLLGSFGITQAAALAYGIGAQSASYALIVSLGVICFCREKMNIFGRASPENVARTTVPAMD